MNYLTVFLLGVFALLYSCFLIMAKVSLKKTKEIPLYIIIVSKNNENCIEGIIRSFISNIKKHYKKGSLQKIVVIDHSSTDNTLNIINSLAREYDFIKIITKQDYYSFDYPK